MKAVAMNKGSRDAKKRSNDRQKSVAMEKNVTAMQKR